MTGLHFMLIHFPIGFWSLATLMIIVGALFSGRLAELSRAALLPVLILSLLGALASIGTGIAIWPLEGSMTSSLTRNHILMALWSFGLFTMLTVLVWQGGKSAFDGTRRWALLILALTGGLLFGTTGTLGGYLVGAPTQFSMLLAAVGWNPHYTFYSPNWVLAVMVIIGLLCAIIGYRVQKDRV